MRPKLPKLTQKIAMPIFLLSLWGCAASQAVPAQSEQDTTPVDSNEQVTVSKDLGPEEEQTLQEETFTPKNYDQKPPKAQTKLDSLFAKDAFLVKKITLVQKEKQLQEQKSKGRFIIQFEAVADFDAAQKRRSIIEKKTGYGVYMTFDAPFYKLRGGSWDDREDAEDAAHKLLEIGLGGYVIKL